MLERLEKLRKLLGKGNKRPLIHVALNLSAFCSIDDGSGSQDKDIEYYREYLGAITKVLIKSINSNIPVVSILLMRTGNQPDNMIKAISEFLERLTHDRIIHDNKVKITVLGKWYDLPSSSIEKIKRLVDETRDYDQFFLNLCLQYDGQEELLDGMRIIATKVKNQRIEADIDYSVIKDNIYSSYFPPPDLIFIPDNRKKTDGLLLWDSKNSRLFLSEKPFQKHGESEFIKAIENFPD